MTMTGSLTANDGTTSGPSANGTDVHYDAILFDMDGVLTGTARVHEAAWKETFDAFLERWRERTGRRFEPFSTDDYMRYVDGKMRMDGVHSFLSSRAIELPEYIPEDDAAGDSVAGLAEEKNRRVGDMIRPDTIVVFPGSVALVRSVRGRGLRTAVVSASQNCRQVLKVAGLTELFDAVIDGNVIVEKHLRGKPAPDPFLEGARQLNVSPAHAVVIEDAIAGVRAGREGGVRAGHWGGPSRQRGSVTSGRRTARRVRPLGVADGPHAGKARAQAAQAPRNGT
jgi:beta-phosphoglucomutase family hydrolase